MFTTEGGGGSSGTVNEYQYPLQGTLNSVFFS